MNRTYKNATSETLASRNPRFSLGPGDSILLTPETISHIVRGWIRIGALELVPEETVAKKTPSKTPAKKTKAAA